MTNRFSKRTGWDVSENALAAAIRKAKADRTASGQRVLDLTISNPTLCGFSYDHVAVLGQLGDPAALVYEADPRGMRSAREAVVAYYADHGAVVDTDHLLLTTSTSEAYGYLFRLLCDAGDEVLVAQPGYPLFDFLADLEDVQLRSYSLFYDFGWWIDFAELERRITPRTKAILVVHPNNPTGHWTSRNERVQLQQICIRHNLALIVDEVFLDYSLTPSEDAVSFATGDHEVLTFILSGLSKIAALPQMKVAWIASSGPAPECTEALNRLEVIADTFLSMNSPAQHALPAWLASRTSIQEQVLERVRTNLRFVQASLLEVSLTAAGWSAILRCGHSAQTLIEEQGVVVQPGSFYGIDGNNRIVVSLLTSTADFEEGIRRIASC